MTRELTRRPGYRRLSTRSIDPPAVLVEPTFALLVTRRPYTSIELPVYVELRGRIAR
jgi:hypothetical protein